MVWLYARYYYRLGWDYIDRMRIYRLRKNPWELFGFGFVVLYGWEMLTALLRYKITNEYSIDSGKLGPTEVRIIISLILILEVLVNGSIHYSTALACIILLITNIIDTIKLLKLGDIRDKKEKEGC